jgi:hypothetical protein
VTAIPASPIRPQNSEAKMAIYKDETNVVKGHGVAFETTHKPGTIAQYSGIYRCENCGDEDACNKGNPLPPQNHAQHTTGAPIEWRLLVYAQQKS